MEVHKLFGVNAFASGYIIAFCGAGSHTMTGADLTAKQTFPYLHAVLVELLGDREAVEPAIDKIFSIRESQAYAEGRSAAQFDIRDWAESQGRKVPMLLSRHLS